MKRYSHPLPQSESELLKFLLDYNGQQVWWNMGRIANQCNGIGYPVQWGRDCKQWFKTLAGTYQFFDHDPVMDRYRINKGKLFCMWQSALAVASPVILRPRDATTGEEALGIGDS